MIRLNHCIITIMLMMSSLNALTLQEAVKIALKNNLEVKSFENHYQQALYDVELKQIPFLPKANFTYDYNHYDRVKSNREKKEATLEASISYNLFNGFQDVSNKKASQFLSQVSFYQLNALKQDIVLTTKKNYIDVLYQQKRLKTFQSAYALFIKQYEDAKNRFDQGLLSKNDLLQIDVNRSTAQQNVVRAKADVLIAKERLNNTLGLEQSHVDQIKPLSNHFNETLYDKKALKNRSELQALKMQLKALYENRKANKNSVLPTIDTSVSHQQFYEDPSFSRLDGNITDQNLITLNVSWKLHRGFTTQVQDKIYLSEISRIKLQLHQLKLDINLQYVQAKTDLDVAQSNYQTAILALKQAQENYSIVNNRFKEGIDSSTDLIDANYLLTLAKQNHSKAYFDQYIADASLKRVLEK